MQTPDPSQQFASADEAEVAGIGPAIFALTGQRVRGASRRGALVELRKLLRIPPFAEPVAQSLSRRSPRALTAATPPVAAAGEGAPGRNPAIIALIIGIC